MARLPGSAPALQRLSQLLQREVEDIPGFLREPAIHQQPADAQPAVTRGRSQPLVAERVVVLANRQQLLCRRECLQQVPCTLVGLRQPIQLRLQLLPPRDLRVGGPGMATYPRGCRRSEGPGRVPDAGTPRHVGASGSCASIVWPNSSRKPSRRRSNAASPTPVPRSTAPSTAFRVSGSARTSRPSSRGRSRGQGSGWGTPEGERGCPRAGLRQRPRSTHRRSRGQAARRSGTHSP